MAAEISEAEIIARMQRILSQQLEEIEREQNRPAWLYPAVGAATVFFGIAIMAGVILVAKHLL
jgi:hypothetical protein